MKKIYSGILHYLIGFSIKTQNRRLKPQQKTEWKEAELYNQSIMIKLKVE